MVYTITITYDGFARYIVHLIHNLLNIDNYLRNITSIKLNEIFGVSMNKFVMWLIKVLFIISYIQTIIYHVANIKSDNPIK